MTLETIPCWLIPLLTGLISAILGYLLGRLAVSKWKDKASKFQDNLDVCKKDRIKLESDLKVANAITGNDSEFEVKISDLEAKLALSQANERSFEEEVSQWKTKAVNLETQVASYATSSNTTDDTEQWKNRVTSLEDNLKSVHETKAKLEADLNGLRDKNAQLESDLAISASKLEESSKQESQKDGDEAEIWKKRVADLQEKLITNKTKMSSLKTELEEAKNASSNNKEVDTLKSKIASLEEELRKAKTSVAPTIENTSSIASSLAGVSSVVFDADLAKSVFGKKIKQDDLTIVEGIGPKIQGLFHDFGVKTWVALSQCSVEKCQEVLDSGGTRYRMHNPTTWPKQAGFAAEGKWEALKKWQDELDGGR